MTARAPLRSSRLALAAGSLSALIALPMCDSEGARAPASDDADLTYWEHIKPIIDARCANCHVEGGIGPFPLESYEDVAEVLPVIGFVVSSRQMPPWQPSHEGKPLLGDMSLSDEEIARITTWVDRGGPEGDPADEGPALPRTSADLSRVDATLTMAEPFTPTLAPDEYRCFVLDWSFTTTKYVTGHRVNPGNTSIVHHAVGFIVAPELAERVLAFDAADPGPGYGCFGGPTPEKEDQLPASFAVSWAPGNFGLDRPAGTGIAVRPGSLFVLQVHYNLDHPTDPGPDLTTVDLSLADDVATRAFTLPWFDFTWYFQPEQMLIPAGESRVTHAYEATLSGSGGVTALAEGETFAEGVLLHAALPHMHTFGERITISVTRANGSRETLLEIPKWDFHWQREYVFAEPQVINPGDKLAVACEWDNSDRAQPFVDGERQSPRDLTWGEGTADEMCIAMIYVTPR